MLLPPSLGLFVRQLGARPYVPEGVTSLETYTENLRYQNEDNKLFGISGIYNDDRVLNIVVAEREQGVSFQTLTEVSVAIYRVQVDARRDVLVKQFDLDLDLILEDNRWELTYRADDPEELVIAALVKTSTNTYASWVPVEVDGDIAESLHSIISYVQPNHSLDQGDRWHRDEATHATITLDTSPNKIELNFRNYGDPRVGCLGELTYQGGGNRYLFSQDGVAIEQKEDKAPWDLDCGAFIEPKATQLYSDFGFHEGKWKYITTGVMTLESYQTFELFPQHRMLVHTVQAPAHDDTTWELVLDPVTWNPGKPTTFSAFLEASLKADSHIKLSMGLRILEVTGEVRHEVFEDVSDFTFGLRQLTLPPTVEASGRVSGVIRLKHLYPGDRVVLGTAMPQLEYLGSATSRCWGLRESDSITYVPESVEYTREFGRFRIGFYPGYQGIPSKCGDQYLFDTRSGSGKNGWYLVHKTDGVLEFGCVDEDGLKHWVESASVINLPQDLVEVTCWYGDFGFRLDVNGNRAGRTHLVPAQTPDMLAVVRLGRDYTEQLCLTGELTEYSWEPINDNVD